MEERAVKWEEQPTGVRTEKGCSEEWGTPVPRAEGQRDDPRLGKTPPGH